MDHAAGDILRVEDLASVRDQLVTTVEKPDFYRLLGVDVIRQRSAQFLPRRAACAEIIFDHRLLEIFERHRRGILYAEAARDLRVGCVVDDIGVVCVKSLGHRIHVVAALRHGEVHDTDRGIRHLRDKCCVALLDRHKADHGADDPGGPAFRFKLDQGRQVVLVRQARPPGRIVRAHSCPDDRPVLRLIHVHQAVQVPRLIGPVEIIQADVNYAGSKVLPVVGRHLHS